MAGRFITIEGGDCCGKSTQARLLAHALAERGRAVLLTHEPGGTPGADRLRAFILGLSVAFDPLGEALLHFAARADHIARTLRPALAADLTVVCDRFSDSTLAYQGYGQGADLAMITGLAQRLGLVPDLTFILDIPRAVQRERMQGRRAHADRYERLGEEFFARVDRGFRAIAAAHPGRCVVINSAADVRSVHARLLTLAEGRLA